MPATTALGSPLRGLSIGRALPKPAAVFRMKTVYPIAPVSAADLNAFLSKVGNNEAIRSKIHAASGVNDILAIAESHGFSLSKPAVIRAHAEALSKASDQQLERVNTWGDALMHCFGATDAD